MPMLSLDNAFNDVELQNFETRVLDRLKISSIEYAGEPKLDGVAVSLRYSNGELNLQSRGVTVLSVRMLLSMLKQLEVFHLD